MINRTSSQNRRIFAIVSLIALALALTLIGEHANAQSATAIATVASTTASTAAPTARSTGSLTSLTLFLGYIPNIQFAPIYVAVERGYFAARGLNVTLEHSYNETDGLTRIGVGQLQFGIISGEQVVLARSKGAPVDYVYRWYQRFPVGVAVPADSGITNPAQLKGHIVSVPAKYGASYIGFEALLNAVGLTDSDLKEVREIGFNTAPIMCARQVEASVIYVANEPTQIASQCFKVTVFPIADYANLVANGLVTNDATIHDHPEWIKAMAAAIAQGTADTIADPNAAYTIAQKYVQGLGDDPLQHQVLADSLALWKAVDPTQPPGYSDPAGWALTQKTLLAMKLIPQEIDPTQVYSNAFLPPMPMITPTGVATMAGTAATMAGTP